MNGANTNLSEVPFVNEMRLDGRHWAIVAAILFLILTLTPLLWRHLERFETGADYRIPYPLSRDYWLYERRLREISDPAKIVILGDSVIWGEYVLPNGTLAHFLNQEKGGRDRFVNGGVNGLFPLAIEGLIRDYATSLRQRKVILHCNLLWMSSPKADLQTEKEERINHARLIPQFSPRIPCYKADANERLSVLVERNVPFMSWASHLQSAYFHDKSIPVWTYEEDGNYPPHYPNAYKNPLTQIHLEIPKPAEQDPERGPTSTRHKPWLETAGSPAHFDWVELQTSLQWGGFKRALEKLTERGNDVMVLLGPFNEHMIASASLPGYQSLRAGVIAWLAEHKIRHMTPPPLSTTLYADASHPLTEGYAALARMLAHDAQFTDWLGN